MPKKILLEQFSDEVDIFKLVSSYYNKNGLEMTKKVLNKIIETLEKRQTGHRAPKDKGFYTESKKKKESKEGAGAYDAPAYSMEPDHVHFKHPNLKLNKF